MPRSHQLPQTPALRDSPSKLENWSRLRGHGTSPEKEGTVKAADSKDGVTR